MQREMWACIGFGHECKEFRACWGWGVYTAFDLGWIWAGEEGGLEHAGERGSTLLLTWWDEFE